DYAPVKKLEVVGDINATAQLFLPLQGSGGGIVIGGDVQVYRGAANRLDLASGDNLNIVSGALQIAGTTVIDSSRNVYAVLLNGSRVNATEYYVGATRVIDANRNVVNVGWVNATNLNATQAVRASAIYQGNNQVIDTISQAGPILVTGTGSSRTINLSTPLALNYGGTNAALTAIAGGIVYSTSSSLAISSAGSPGQILVSGGSGAPTWTSSLTLSGLTVDTNTLYIDTVNHRVGIGTTSPQNKLNVIGDLNVTGTIYGTLNGPYNPSGDLDMGGNKIYNASFIHTRGFGVASDLTTAENNKPSGYSVYVQDHVRVGGNILGAGADIAERVFVDGSLEAGDVVIITDNLKVSKSYKPYDTRVAGIISTKPHYILAEERDGKPLALAGIVPVKVTIENGVIKVGDLLTTSNKPGYAMKCDDVQKCRGAIIGKAMQNAYSDGKIEVLVMLA
ncbi:MAG: hypothetical protein QXL86_03810, partial [Candidatus Aenigmatarchaeota archaeon]